MDKRKNQARALSTFYSLSAGLEPACIARIKQGILTVADLDDFEVKQANSAWKDYRSETPDGSGSRNQPAHVLA